MPIREILLAGCCLSAVFSVAPATRAQAQAGPVTTPATGTPAQPVQGQGDPVQADAVQTGQSGQAQRGPGQSGPGLAGLAPSGTVEIPAGTRVLLALRSGVNTRSAQPGDGVYLSSTFPVVVGTQVAIPAGVYVQGVIDRVTRAGRVKGRAEVGMHFTTMIFPNGSVVSIPGVVNAVPGSIDSKVKDNEGNIQQASSKGKDAGDIARSAETGASIGAIGGAVGGSPLAGAGYGALAGGAAGLIYTLLTRGSDLNLEQGQTVEMVLQRPLTLQPTNLAASSGEASALAPVAQQPMRKPDHPRMLCPIGGLGCP